MDFTLNNGVNMPVVGLGTFLAKDGIETYEAVLEALKAGYRHIDTAKIYQNEVSVGKAIKDSKISRKDLFITTKLWNTEQGYLSTKAAFMESMENLQLDYLDLYLIHWPTTYQQARDSWRAMEELYYEGKVRAIGVSNFNIHHIDDLLKVANVIPAVNQVELHPGLQQHKLQAYCMGRGIFMVSHTPLMKGQVFEIDELKQLAQKYHKSVVNIVVRWGIQRNIFMIPKSVTKERIISNLDVFDFSLSDDDMKMIRKLNNGKRLISDPDNKD
jgi:diketogulonate reductase-like aldo/keto reductase